MEQLFSSAGRDALESLRREDTFYGFDLDGTLAGITPRPKDTILTRRTEELLKRLAREHRGKLAIVSGRARKDLRRLIHIPGVVLIGNHGIEGSRWPDEAALKHRLRSECRLWRKQLEPVFRSEKGCELENKLYTLSLHYRNARYRIQSKRHLLAAIRSLSPQPRLILGKEVFNLVPRSAPDKGAALVQLTRTSRSRRALFIGDDATDEDAFRMQKRFPHWVTIRVGKNTTSCARFYVSNQAEVDEVLASLLAPSSNPS